MSTYYVLRNRLSGEGDAAGAKAQALAAFYSDDTLVVRDVQEIASYQDFFAEIGDTPVIIAGGDGTLNHFANETDGIAYNNPVYYFATGTGNDFLRDLGIAPGSKPVQINQYLKNLPICIVKGKRYRFINNVGFGIDGYCTEEGDRQKAAGKTNVNYTGIAIKGLLFHYKPCDAVVVADGKRYEFTKVWLAPCMHGRYYGGGMMAAPAQDRLNAEGTQTVMVFSGKGKLPTLIAFPSIFKGEHVTKSVTHVIPGKSFHVEFGEPRPLQIDGETILDVTSYDIEPAPELG